MRRQESLRSKVVPRREHAVPIFCTQQVSLRRLDFYKNGGSCRLFPEQEVDDIAPGVGKILPAPVCLPFDEHDGISKQLGQDIRMTSEETLPKLLILVVSVRRPALE